MVDWSPPPELPADDTQEFESHRTASMDWRNQLFEELRRVVGSWAKAAGYSANAGQAFVNANRGALLSFIEKEVFGAGQVGYDSRMQNFTTTVGGFQNMTNAALNWLGARLPFRIPEATGSGGGGGGRGGGGPTAADIRGQFDIEELANRVQDLSRTFLITEHANPRQVARAYVEAVVKNPSQRLDFDTYVRSQLQKDPRWNIIMQNKPTGMDEAQYVQQYAQRVMQVLGGGEEASQIAFEQAALGSSQEAVGERLSRSRAVRSSSEFVNTFEDTLRQVGEILR